MFSDKEGATNRIVFFFFCQPTEETNKFYKQFLANSTFFFIRKIRNTARKHEIELRAGQKLSNYCKGDQVYKVTNKT